jgi:hypothetical protein
MRKKDMNKLFTNGMALLIAAGCLVPAGASASTIFTFSNLPSTGTYNTTTGVTSITFNSLNINGSSTSGTFTETYTNSTGILTIAGTDATLGLSGTLITIQDSPAVTVAASTTINLYGAVSSITFNSSTFASDLGLTGVTSVLPSSVIAENFGITTQAAVSNSAQVSSSVASLTLPVSTPEPSTFAMLGLAMIAAGCIPVRRKLGLIRQAR